jgi:hypothetical protein
VTATPPTATSGPRTTTSPRSSSGGFVAQALERLDDAGLRERAASAVTRFDDELRGFTEPDARGLVRRFAAADAGGPDPVREWWWFRIPVSGPVRAELEGFATDGG